MLILNMDHYEVEIKVNGVFLHKIKPNITKDIRVINEYSEKKGKDADRTILSVMTEAESIWDAVDNARNIVYDFLGFYSFTTLNHLDIIIPNVDDPMKITNLTNQRKSTLVSDDIEYTATEFDNDIFINSIFPYFLVLSKKGNEYLKIASNYLRKARFEKDPASIILDCFIVLEGLYGKSGDKTEIAYKISNRVATLLGEDIESRKMIRKEIKDLYGLRSQIIHGDISEVAQDAFGRVVVYCRESLARFLTLAKTYSSQDTILTEIDDAMIDNSIVLKLRQESTELFKITQIELGKLMKKEIKQDMEEKSDV